MNRKHRADAAQAEIVQAIRRIGWHVRVTSQVGNDFPDLICAGYVPTKGFRTVLLEVKSAGEALSKGQEQFAATWPGERHTVHSAAEAMEALLGSALA